MPGGGAATVELERKGLPPLFDRRDIWIAGAIFLIALLAYARTLAPDVLFGDSGEFQVLAVTGGLSHATGYPVYLLIAKLFTLLPFGSIAVRVNLVSAIFASLAVATMYLLARSLEVRRIFSAVGALALLISPIFWSQAIIAEVYTISAAFFVGFLLCLVTWSRSRDAKWLAAGGLLGGLCLGLHHTVLLALPFVLIYLLLAKGKKGDWSYAAGGVLAGVALAFAAYMVEGSIDSAPTSTNFLHPYATQFGMKSSDDLDAPLTRVRFVFFAEQFKGDVQTRHLSINAPKVAKEILDDFGWVVPLLGFVGAVALLSTSGRRREGILLVGPWVVITGFALMLYAFDIDVEFIQPHMLMCLLASVGLQGIQNLAFRGKDLQRRLYAASAALGSLAVAIGSGGGAPALSALGAGSPTFLTGIQRSFPFPVDHPTEPHDLARAVVGSVPDGSMLLLQWTYTYACYYVAQFEQNKPGVDIVVGFPDPPPSDRDARFTMSYYIANARKRPLFADTENPAMDAVFKHIPVVTDPTTGRVYLYRLVLRHP